MILGLLLAVLLVGLAALVVFTMKGTRVDVDGDPNVLCPRCAKFVPYSTTRYVPGKEGGYVCKSC